MAVPSGTTRSSCQRSFCRDSRSPGAEPGGEHARRRAGDDDAAVEGEAVIVEAEPADVRLDARAAQREGAFARIGLEPEAPHRLARLQRGLASVRDVAGRRQLHGHERLVAVAEERQPDRFDVRHVPDGERQAIRCPRRTASPAGRRGCDGTPSRARAGLRSRAACRAIRAARSYARRRRAPRPRRRRARSAPGSRRGA